jgi:hypothetical protein
MSMAADGANPYGHSYENQAMMDKHIASAPVQDFIKGIEQGLVKSSKIIYTDYHGEIGFSSRL